MFLYDSLPLCNTIRVISFQSNLLHQSIVYVDSTTSFLTTTALVYAIGAGITAAAGTRLALQLILDKGFKVISFQLHSLG